MTEPITKRGAGFAGDVIELYAEGLDGLTKEDCQELELPEGGCRVLMSTLGKGREGEVKESEKLKLQEAGFSKEFIDALAGKDRLKALQRRVRWLADNIEDTWFFPCCNTSERKRMIQELGEMESLAADAVPNLIETLEDEDPQVRLFSVKALEKIGWRAASALPALIETLDDKEKKVREVAAEVVLSLVNTTTREVVPDLVRLLEGEDIWKRKVAVEALGKISLSATEAAPALIQVLKFQKGDMMILGVDSVQNEYSELRRHAKFALDKMGRLIVPHLVKALEEEKDAQVKRNVAEILGNLGLLSAVPALVSVLNDDSFFVRKEAAIALSKSDPENGEAVPIWIGVLKTGQAKHSPLEWIADVNIPGWYRDQAGRVLNFIGIPAFPALIHLLESDDSDVRSRTLSILSVSSVLDLKEKREALIPAIPKLQSLAQYDPDPNIRRMAAETLERLEGEMR